MRFAAALLAALASFVTGPNVALAAAPHGLYKTFYEDTVSNIRKWLDTKHK
jgi:hypothetical protein